MSTAARTNLYHTQRAEASVASAHPQHVLPLPCGQATRPQPYLRKYRGYGKMKLNLHQEVWRCEKKDLENSLSKSSPYSSLHPLTLMEAYPENEGRPGRVHRAISCTPEVKNHLLDSHHNLKHNFLNLVCLGLVIHTEVQSAIRC